MAMTRWITVGLVAAVGCGGGPAPSDGGGTAAAAPAPVAEAAAPEVAPAVVEAPVPQAPAARSATFEARHAFTFTMPEGASGLRAWLAIPQDDPLQTVSDLKIESPVPTRVTTDAAGNRVCYLEVKDPAQRSFEVVQTFVISRREQRGGADAAKTRPLTDAERAEHAATLAPNTHVVIDDTIRKLAAEIVGDETNPVTGARKIYDWVLANVDYWVKDPANKKASPVGSTLYCLEKRTGNCTDFHSLWTSLARAAGIPTRMVYGSFFKGPLDGKPTDQSYHCWPEFFAPQIGWVPHDVAVADLFVADFTLDDANRDKVRLTTANGYEGPDAAMVEYYFGNIDERRVTWSRGRDLQLDPAPAAGTVNMLGKAWVEVDGKPGAEKTVWTRTLTFHERR